MSLYVKPPEGAPSSHPAVKIDSHLQYHSSGLTEADLMDDPILLFTKWFDEARQSGLVAEPEAVCVSTSTPDGQVSSRFVLLKRVDSQGFVFFTNYESRKARELESNPRGAMAFYWGPLHQQIRICGRTHKITAEETLEYFKTRPVGSQIGAWASPQSAPIAGRAQLMELVSEKERAFGVEPGCVDRESPLPSDLAATVPLPPHWGGIRLVPDEIEFWVGRPNRLHDRFVFRRTISETADPSSWTKQRLAP